jgi:hypothetical protein
MLRIVANVIIPKLPNYSPFSLPVTYIYMEIKVPDTVAYINAPVSACISFYEDALVSS